MRINLIFVLFLILFSGCSSYRYNDHFFGPDKFCHFTVAGAIGAGVTVAADANGASHHDAPIIGTSVAVTFGAGKEFYDLKIKETSWSWKDMFWDLAGGFAGSYVVAK